MTGWSVVVAAVMAATTFAASSVLKHRGARASDGNPTSGVGWQRFAARPRLLAAGLVCDAVGVALQAWALRHGSLVLVQCVLVFNVPLAVLLGGRPRRAQIAWSALLATSLLSLVSFTRTAPRPAAVDVPAVVLTAPIATLMVIVLTVIAVRHVSGRTRPVLLGLAAGIVYAATAALLKVVSVEAAHGGLVAALAHWPVYMLVAAGIAGVLLAQEAFRSGPVSSVLPAAAVADPMASLIIGVCVFDEKVPFDAVHLIGVAASMTVLALAVRGLTRHTSDAAGSSTVNSAPPPEQLRASTAPR